MKKILLIITIIFCIFQMVVLATTIDIGSPAIDRALDWGSRTIVAKTNPANESGTITSVEIWAAETVALDPIYDCEVATFFIVGENTLSTRDWEAIGTVNYGSKQTFPVNIDVQAGDYIGMYFSSGEIEIDSSGGDGIWTVSDFDRIPCTDSVFNPFANYIFSLYATGTTEEEGANAIFFGTNF